MSKTPTMVLQEHVVPEFVDYNGHMNDAAYVKVFSHAIDLFLQDLGLDAFNRERLEFSVYTLENHVRYLQECHEGQTVQVTVQLIDHDAKRLHLFLVMMNEASATIATSEQMLIGVSTKSGRSAPFPEEISKQVRAKAITDGALGRPVAIGRTIGIRRR